MKMERYDTRRNKKWLIGVLVLVVLALIGGYWVSTQNNSIVSNDLLPAIKDAKDRTVSEVAQEEADANYFTLNINPTAVFKDGSSEGSIEIINDESNVYPIDVQITLDSTGEVIYTSGAIYPNKEVTTGTLDKVLEKGEYSATATVNIYHPETLEKKGATQAAMKIIIEN